MKFTLALIASAFAMASAKTVDISPKADIKADSKMGQNLLSKARRLEENGNGEIDYTWVAGYSLKFQGCHHISQWNADADEEEDVKIATERLVRFRMCPTGSCNDNNAYGCKSGYGDYIVDMATYLDAYLEAKMEREEAECEYTMNYQCDCQDKDDDQFNQEYCEYDCFMAKDMGYCVEDNPYVDDDNQEAAFAYADYVECAQYQFNNNNGRKLDENAEVEYSIGPFCSEQGGQIVLGLFTDDTCSTFADDYGGKGLFETMAGFELPYSETSLIGMECVSCKEQEDGDNYNDQQDADEVKETCEMIYNTAGKCEKSLNNGVTANNNACNYIEGIRIVRQDGIIKYNNAGGNKTASVFIGLFAVSFILLGAYVYYLKTKLDRAKINLAE
uniref:Uncharacterized protein n=1 Tax=Attheya septentrionalis TaxID=420275 RepID=A0A7S2UPK0_9STRA|mmetsp:Transcript_712/g.1304  ORF Transcript_712/g.1304 Transcript_712/m.1304 type:complete len:388 (+) Transcript_712:66-1229(+)